MSVAKERWKKSFNNIVSSSSSRLPRGRTDSVASYMSMASVVDEDIQQDEVDTYLSTLKNKTGLKGLWRGNKFDGLLDVDKTPDISIGSSDDDDKINAMDFKKFHLDSDEDEMRINYMREASVDVNNNNIIDSDDESVDNEPFNLMQNIQFAELQLNDVQLSDDEDLKQMNVTDYLPNVYTLDDNDDDDKNNKDTDTESDYQVGNNIKFLNSVESEIEQSFKVNSYRDGDSIQSVISKEGSIITDEVKSETVNSETNKSIYSKTVDETTEYSQTDFESESFTISKSKNRHRKKSRTSASQSVASRKYSHKHKQHSDTDTISSTSSFSTSSSTADDSYVSKKSYLKSHTRKHSHRHSKNTKRSKNTETQTDNINFETNNILNFKYPWQLDRPNNIATNAIGADTLHVLSSYNPAVLAAHDMMKYHFKLLKQHVDNSRRLYESYSIDSNSNFNYTTVEDTMKFIKQNKPKVISYEEALKRVKEEEKI